MTKTTFFFLMCLTVFSFGLRAEEYNMTRCALLPITDSVGGAIGVDVYKKIEGQLKYDSWCDYRPISGMYDILMRHRDNLKEYLNNKDVIRAISEKLEVGSIIKLHLEGEIDRIRVEMEVVGANGSDTYFKEKLLLEKVDTTLIEQTVVRWLEQYEKEIPYDGIVVGILGDQLTIDTGRTKKIEIGSKFRVSRKLGKKKHPLLKKVVEWEKEQLAEGKVFNSSESKVLGQVRVYRSNKKIRKDDWVSFEPVIKMGQSEDEKFPEVKGTSFGKLGKVRLGLSLSQSSIATSVNNNSKTVDGFTFGFDVEGEAWITRSWIVKGEISRSFGSLSKDQGNLSQNSVNVINGTFKLLGGHRFLPLGFFYGPQIDIYGGYGSFSYGPDKVAADGFSESSFSGLIIGAKVDMPIMTGIRAFGNVEMMPIFSKFSDEDGVYGKADSTSMLLFEVGGSYAYDQSMTIDGAVEVLSNKAKFGSSPESLHYKDTKFKLSASYTF